MFKRILKVFGLGAAALVALIAILVTVAIMSPHGRLVLPVKHKERFEHPRLSEFPAMLHTSGTKIVVEPGEAVLLRGVMPSDPARLDSRGLFNRDFYSQIHETGANAIRIPVHPERWARDPDYLWRHLDPIVGWAGEMGMYVIIDWHYIGNIDNGEGSEMPDIEGSPHEMTMDFWKLVAAYFRPAPNVIFEIWNEPAGGILPDTWQGYAAELVRTIRAQGAEQPIIIGGVDYSRDLSWVLANPVPDSNVIYAVHIFPAHTQSNWDGWFGTVSEQYPVLVTEWGFMDENRDEAPVYLRGSRDSYGDPLLQYLDAHDIGWIACWYDDTWQPPMFNPGWDKTSLHGQFVLEQLRLH